MFAREIAPVLRRLARRYPVVTVTGPRQSGKTTLCRASFPGFAYANLEAPDVRSFAREDPRGFLAQFASGAILDEVQRAPDLLSYLQTAVDERRRPGQFILTGSEQFEVMNRLSQSLAGRTALLKLLPASIGELSGGHRVSPVDRLLFHGFYPRIWDRGLDPTQALGDYFETYVQRDLRSFANLGDLGLFEKFARLCAGRVGQIVNLSGLANDTGISHVTARKWLTLLEASYIVYVLKPWYRNAGKRLVKSPKLYFIDVGLAGYLLGIHSQDHLRHHPLRGSLFENLCVIEALKFRLNRGERDNLYFYRDSDGNEIDLLLEYGNGVYPVEIKAGATFSGDYLKGLRALARLCGRAPNGGAVVYGGDVAFVREGANVLPVHRLPELLASAR